MICWARPLIKVYSLIQRLDCERKCKEESKPFIQGQDHTWSDFVPVSPCNSQRWQGLLCITLLHCFVPFGYFAKLLLNSQQSKVTRVTLHNFATLLCAILLFCYFATQQSGGGKGHFSCIVTGWGGFGGLGRVTSLEIACNLTSVDHQTFEDIEIYFCSIKTHSSGCLHLSGVFILTWDAHFSSSPSSSGLTSRWPPFPAYQVHLSCETSWPILGRNPQIPKWEVERQRSSSSASSSWPLSV